jgi:hypothetical protein
MSKLSTGIFGVVAVSLSLGAAQFAVGRDLSSGVLKAEAIEPGINRAAKADRASVVVASQAPTRTISLRFEGLSDTSILLRVPAAPKGSDRSSARPVGKTGGQRMVACEPMVSVLTEIAKQLQPGRCVT